MSTCVHLFKSTHHRANLFRLPVPFLRSGEGRSVFRQVACLNETSYLKNQSLTLSANYLLHMKNSHLSWVQTRIAGLISGRSSFVLAGPRVLCFYRSEKMLRRHISKSQCSLKYYLMLVFVIQDVS